MLPARPEPCHNCPYRKDCGYEVKLHKLGIHARLGHACHNERTLTSEGSVDKAASRECAGAVHWKATGGYQYPLISHHKNENTSSATGPCRATPANLSTTLPHP